MDFQASSARAPHVSAMDFRLGMRCLAAGVSVVTSRDGSRPTGLLATSVVSVSAEPPTVLVSVNRHSISHGVIEAIGAYCVNLLAADQEPIARQFADPRRRGERFDTGEWKEMVTGCPVLVGAMAVFDCDVVERMRYHSHTIFLGLVREVRVSQDKVGPLVHHNRQYGSLQGVGPH